MNEKSNAPNIPVEKAGADLASSASVDVHMDNNPANEDSRKNAAFSEEGDSSKPTQATDGVSAATALPVLTAQSISNSSSCSNLNIGEGTAPPEDVTRNNNDIIKQQFGYAHGLKFPWRLHVLLEQVEENGFSNAISWLPDGKSFRVHDKVRFSTEILPAYFKTSTYKAFQRNLNLWEFQTVSKGPDKGVCSHPYFQRGKPELCSKMQRTRIKKKADNEIGAEGDNNAVGEGEEVLSNTQRNPPQLDAARGFVPNLLQNSANPFLQQQQMQVQWQQMQRMQQMQLQQLMMSQAAQNAQQQSQKPQMQPQQQSQQQQGQSTSANDATASSITAGSSSSNMNTNSKTQNGTSPIPSGGTMQHQLVAMVLQQVQHQQQQQLLQQGSNDPQQQQQIQSSQGAQTQTGNLKAQQQAMKPNASTPQQQQQQQQQQTIMHLHALQSLPQQQPATQNVPTSTPTNRTSNNVRTVGATASNPEMNVEKQQNPGIISSPQNVFGKSLAPQNANGTANNAAAAAASDILRNVNMNLASPMLMQAAANILGQPFLTTQMVQKSQQQQQQQQQHLIQQPQQQVIMVSPPQPGQQQQGQKGHNLPSSGIKNGNLTTQGKSANTVPPSTTESGSTSNGATTDTSSMLAAKKDTSGTSEPSDEQNESSEASLVPCRARGMPLDHNPRTAYLQIPSNMRHGADLMCSHKHCRDAGIKFLFCRYCQAPVAKKSFWTRHSHLQDKKPAAREDHEMVDESLNLDDSEDESGDLSGGAGDSEETSGSLYSESHEFASSIPREVRTREKNNTHSLPSSSSDSLEQPPRKRRSHREKMSESSPSTSTQVDVDSSTQDSEQDSSSKSENVMKEEDIQGAYRKFLSEGRIIDKSSIQEWQTLLANRPDSNSSDEMSQWLMNVLSVSGRFQGFEEGDDSGSGSTDSVMQKSSTSSSDLT